MRFRAIGSPRSSTPSRTKASTANLRDDERIALTTLGEADPAVADMSTLVMIGSSETRFIDRPGKAPWLLTPRSYGTGR